MIENARNKVIEQDERNKKLEEQKKSIIYQNEKPQNNRINNQNQIEINQSNTILKEKNNIDIKKVFLFQVLFQLFQY